MVDSSLHLVSKFEARELFTKGPELFVFFLCFNHIAFLSEFIMNSFCNINVKDGALFALFVCLFVFVVLLAIFLNKWPFSIPHALMHSAAIVGSQ